MRPKLALLRHVSRAHCDVVFCGDHVNESNTATEDVLLVDVRGRPGHLSCISFIVPSVSNLSQRIKILNHGQVTWTTPELAPPSPNYHTPPTGGCFSSRQI
ncbi:hypothetical protein TNCV_1900581 [Trichonephila clavipes]|nr:hypothetical protein TNCV_1900581 [Trichonephila clavipes]